jgi:hypothetical protein
MQQPVTELDTRFSDQNAIATDWEVTRRALERAFVSVPDLSIPAKTRLLILRDEGLLSVRRSAHPEGRV